ncbi:hypothetical protein J6590_053446 [Homalodisca vitripennis]|nr:hypothetical protein J6590_053446 [Homalodisca vitripennis]
MKETKMYRFSESLNVNHTPRRTTPPRRYRPERIAAVGKHRHLILFSELTRSILRGNTSDTLLGHRRDEINTNKDLSSFVWKHHFAGNTTVLLYFTPLKRLTSLRHKAERSSTLPQAHNNNTTPKKPTTKKTNPTLSVTISIINISITDVHPDVDIISVHSLFQ